MDRAKDESEYLGIFWDSSRIFSPEELMAREVRVVLFRLKKALPDYIFHDGYLEGNPISWPEVKTLMDGVSVGGHKVSDVEQILNLKRAWGTLVSLVQGNRFALTKEMFLKVNSCVAFEEALEWGVFRTGQVGIAGTEYKPPAPEKLPEIFERGLSFLDTIENPIERAMAFSLWTAREQFFWDGNKRTGRIMMAGELLKHGYDALSIPNARREEYNRKMIEFYNSADATEMMVFYQSLFPPDIRVKPVDGEEDETILRG